MLIGTGGLGSGIFLALVGNDTIGREESRGAYLLEGRDFGKLHTITHYVQKLLGKDFLVVPIGRVGDDHRGEEVKEELRLVGAELAHVTTDKELPTLFSVCFVYPTGEGGNLTTLNSASAAVTAETVLASEELFRQFRHVGIALVVPEVPLSAREALLGMATSHDFLRVGSFVAGELRAEPARRLLGQLDLLSINLEEAAALGGTPVGSGPDEIVRAAVSVVQAKNSSLLLVVTAGRLGSWVWDGKALTHTLGFPVTVKNSAGAGDAHLAGLIVGLACGLDIATSNRLASVLSALKVQASDTIAWQIDGVAVTGTAATLGVSLPLGLIGRISSDREFAAEG